ncbi:MAG TPA: MgtC/SapB family protein [Gemmatimonadales bacterium]|nr:MgtC/SapB family protein [Gemmatimonadales bacterium]
MVLETLPASESLVRLGVAALAGLAVGIEREWSGHATGPGARFAGVRTFFLLGLVGGVSGWLTAQGTATLAAVLIAGSVALVTAAYVIASRGPQGDTDGTTEVAAIAVLALGALSGLGEIRIAAGAAAVAVVALREKGRIHEFVQSLQEWELRGALHFAVLALVILPLLPPGPYGPFGGIRPRTLWVLVLIFSGLNYIGFVARRVVGETRGYGVAGLLGGLVSSTAVTLVFSRESRLKPKLARSLGLGIVAACAVLLGRVTVVATVLDPVVGGALAVRLLPAYAVGLGLLLWILRGEPGTRRETADRMSDTNNPLRLFSAIRMAILFQVSLMAVDFARERAGDPGILGLAALLGFTDMDALTVAMARLGASAASIASKAIVIGIISNTVLKLGLALGLGTGPLRRVTALGLVAMGAAAGLGLWLS